MADLYRLGIGQIGDRPVRPQRRDRGVTDRPRRSEFDHRVVDGARAAEFGLAVLRRLEEPAATS